MLVGPAGTGKTFVLDAARAAWESGGHKVVGTALAGRTAAALAEAAGVPSFTLARLFVDAERAERVLPADGVLLVDRCRWSSPVLEPEGARPCGGLPAWRRPCPAGPTGADPGHRAHQSLSSVTGWSTSPRPGCSHCGALRGHGHAVVVRTRSSPRRP